ncbi:GntR family transcriptional regulator [Ruicaihuangia caeni]|uniref:GntR family transcriptional regulator n=1 Tax=Ruicaihuangia caeni TaxID=3042517 RepID=UPI00338FEAC6
MPQPPAQLDHGSRMPPRPRTSDRIHELLRDAIVSGELAHGSAHSIYQLAEQYGVSRTPVREAVLRLADAGMLQIERNQGFRVRGVRVDDIREVFELRLLVEVPMTALAARATDAKGRARLDESLTALDEALASGDQAEFRRRDHELHEAILQLAGNQQAADLVETLRNRTEARGATTLARERTLEDVHAQHTPIVEAIRSGDADAAASHMREHLASTGTMLMHQVAARTGEPVDEGWADRLR